MSFDALWGKKKNCSLNGKFFFIFSDTFISPILRKKGAKKIFPKVYIDTSSLGSEFMDPLVFADPGRI